MQAFPLRVLLRRVLGTTVVPTPILALFGAALTGCGLLGGQGGDDGGAECPIDVREVASDDEVLLPFDFSVRDVLAWATGDHSATARWNEAPDDIDFNVAAGPTGLSLRVTRGEGRAVSTYCQYRSLDIPVRVALTTDDGALDVAREGTLRAVRSDFALIDVELDFAALGGTFAWQSTRSGLTLVQPFVRVAMTPGDMSGRFDAILQLETSDALSAMGGRAPLLQWPIDDACALDQVGGALDEAGPLWRDTLAAANGTTWLDVDSGTPEPMVLEVEADGGLCASARMPPVLPVRVRLQTPDRAFDLTLEGELTETEDGLQFGFGMRNPGGSPDTFVERYGDFGLDLSGYDGVYMALTLRLSAMGGDGHVAVVGMTDPCASLPSDQGCGPLEDEVLLERGFTTEP